MPLTKKITDLITKFNERIIEEAKKYLNDATEIYLIGYRANDEIIDELLRNAKEGSKIIVVNKDDAVSIRNRLCRQYPHLVSDKIYESGFEGFLASF